MGIEATIEEGRLEVRVEDTGVGIANIEQAMLPAYTTCNDRMGLGFSFMQSFMDEVRVESAVNQGTQIYLRKTVKVTPCQPQRNIRAGVDDEYPPVGNEPARFPRLTDDEVAELIPLAQAGDQEAKEKMVNCNLRLVFNLVQRFHHRGYEEEDLFQIGTIGLIKAIEKFDSSFNVKFSTYAVPMIIGEIRRFLRDDHSIKVSRSLKEVAFRVPRVKEELTREKGREPTIGEIAEAMGLPREELVTAIEALQQPASIHETLFQDDGDPIYLLDQLKSEGGLETAWMENIALREVLDKLSERDQQVIRMRFFEDKTQTEVAKVLGLSQVQISRIERQALNLLRELMSS